MGEESHAGEICGTKEVEERGEVNFPPMFGVPFFAQSNVFLFGFSI